MEFKLGTPALLFPAISLLLLAYSNRFFALTQLVRDLHDEYQKKPDVHIIKQIKNLKLRVYMIRNMQAFGILSIFFCVLCMFLLFLEYHLYSRIMFGLALLCMLVSLFISFLEINLSTKALNLELSDIEGLLKKS